MPVFCPHCGVMQPEGVAKCANCGKPMPPVAAPQAETPADEISPAEMRAYVGVVLRYTVVPIVITVAVFCVAWLICINLIR
ncbi:MAG TPA: hypothetical protein VFL17_24050 [Anaerolineae bacterium]|nr:hypothetical protein [Anaerolineae bacterium]